MKKESLFATIEIRDENIYISLENHIKTRSQKNGSINLETLMRERLKSGIKL